MKQKEFSESVEKLSINWKIVVECLEDILKILNLGKCLLHEWEETFVNM